MINIKRIEQQLKLSIKLADVDVLTNLRTGYCSSEPIPYSYGPDKGDTDEVVVCEMYSTTKILNETKRYNKISLQDNLQTIPDKCFILWSDISGASIVYNSITGQLSCFTELSSYSEVPLLNSIHTFSKMLKDEAVYIDPILDHTTKLSIVDVNKILCSLNIVKNDILVNFLLDLDIGSINSSWFKYIRCEVHSESRIGYIYNEKIIIKYNMENKNDVMYKNVLLFGETVGGFFIGLNLSDYSISVFIKENIRIFDTISSFIDFLKK